MVNHTRTISESFSLPATSLDTFLELDARDPRSGLPLGICSLLLRYLLPQLELERYVSHRRNLIQNAQQLFSSRLDARYCRLLITGSSVEGFSVPPYREKKPAGEPDELPGQAGAPFYQASDIDIMTETPFLPVEVRQTPGRLYIDESRASHVGYVRVVLDSPADTYGLSFPVRDICTAVNERGQTVLYLSNEAVKRPLAKLAKDHAEATDVKVNLSGPAVNQEPMHSGQQGLDLIPDTDLVAALPLLGHPPAFQRWLERVTRPDAHWPSRQTVEDIRRNARCFVVITGHASSADRDIECRLSFSDPELRLAKTVTPVQRKVYLLVKLLQKCYLKEPKVVVTYHLKTLMFWLLEGSQPQDWTEQTIFKQVLRFLDKIEECLERREVPSYFYPSNNLISHADPGHVAATLATVRRIRDDPLRHLYGIDERVWMGFSTLTSLSSLHRPVLKVMHEDESSIRLKIANSLTQQASQGTIRDILWPLRCADLLRDTYDVLREVLSEQLGDRNASTEASVLWSTSDWLKLAMIAVFATLRQEENWWLQKASDGFEFPRETSNSSDEDPFREAVALLLPGRPHAAFMLRMFLSTDAGNRLPLESRMTAKYGRMVRQEQLKAALERSNLPPSFGRLFMQDSTTGNQGTASAAEEEEICAFDLREKACSRSTESFDKVEQSAVPGIGGTRLKDITKSAQRSETAGGTRPKDTTKGAQRSETAGGTRLKDTIQNAQRSEPTAGGAWPKDTTQGAESSGNAGGARPKDTTKGAQKTENAAHPDLPRMTTEIVTPMTELQRAGLDAVSSCGGPPPQEPTPDRLVGSLQFQEVYGSCPTLITRLHVPILDIIGHLLRCCPRLACRCAFWMHRLTTYFGGWGPEATPSVPLAAAAQFLQSLPPTSAALLRRPSARAALFPLSAFVIYTAVLSDEPFRRQVAQMEIGDRELAVFDMELQFGDGQGCDQFGDGQECDYDDVVWTNVVMKLCVREMMGQDVRRCLDEVGLARGSDKGKRAKEILKRHRL